MEEHISGGQPLKWISRHLLGLYHGVHGGRWYRRQLSDGTAKGAGDLKFLQNLLDQLPDDV